MEIGLYCPKSLDIKALMEAHANECKGIKHDHLAYIIHAIVTQTTGCYNSKPKGFDKKDGFVPLYSKLLEQKVPRYRMHLDFLLNSQVIESDNQYIKAVTSKGYRLNEIYQAESLKKVEVSDFILRRKLKRNIKPEQLHESKIKYTYLKKWFKSGKLQIDHEAAFQWIDAYQYRQQINILSSKYSAEIIEERERQLRVKCEGYKMHVFKIAQHEYYMHIDSTGNRLHTNLTNISKDLRKFIRYDGKKLVSIDIKNSQPYFSKLLFDVKFWESKESTEFLNLKKISLEVFKKIQGKSVNKKGYAQSIIMFLNSSGIQGQQEFQQKVFFNKAAEGRLYEHLQAMLEFEFNMYLGNSKEEKRNKVKKIMLTLLFDADWKPYNNLPNSPFQLFRQKFPSIAKVFSLIKETDHRNLAILLQRIESFLLLNTICRSINKSYPTIPIFTIHDNIITTVGNENIVRLVMKAELEKVIGVAPSFSVVHW